MSGAQGDLFFADDDGHALQHIGLTMKRGAFAKWSMADLLDEIRPRRYSFTMYGVTGLRRRKEAWYSDSGVRYKFGGGAAILPQVWGARMTTIRGLVECATGEVYDSCFVNYYPNGDAGLDWHADDEEWIGPTIASVSLGASRSMKFRRKQMAPNAWDSPGTPSVRVSQDIQLHHGDLLVMPPGTQDRWEHTMPRTHQLVGPRLNLTFRQTVKV